MKLNTKTIICLIAISILLSVSVEARQRKSLKVQGIFSKTFPDGGIEAKVSVTSDETAELSSEYDFQATLMDIQQDGSKPFGIFFDGQRQLSKIYNVIGFYDFAIHPYKLDGQRKLSEMIDYRQIDNCIFVQTNKQIQFTVNYIEEYREKEIEKFGKSLNIALSFDQDQLVTQYINKLQTNCIARNREVNQLKKKALESGIQYYELYKAFKQKTQSIKTQKDLQIDMNATIADIQNEQQDQTNQYTVEIEKVNANITIIAQNLKNLASKVNQTDDEKLDQIAQIDKLRVDLGFVADGQQKFTDDLQDSQSQLNEIKKIQKEQQASKDTLEELQQKEEKYRLIDLANYENEKERLQNELLKQETDTKIYKEAAEKRKQNFIDELKINKDNISKSDINFKQINNDIESFKLDLENSKQKIVSLNSKIHIYTNSLKKTTSAIKLLEVEKDKYINATKAQKKSIDTINNNNLKKIKLIGDRQRKQNQNLTLNKAEIVRLQKLNQQAVTDALAVFKKDLGAIDETASPASVRTKLALSKCNEDGNAQTQIGFIVCKGDDLIKQAIANNVVAIKERRLLAQSRLAREKQVRLMRKQLRMSLKHKLRANKY